MATLIKGVFMRIVLFLVSAMLLAGCCGDGNDDRRSENTLTPTPSLSREFQRQSIASQEATIPYADVLVYPSDWVAVTRTRQGE